MFRQGGEFRLDIFKSTVMNIPKVFVSFSLFLIDTLWKWRFSAAYITQFSLLYLSIRIGLWKVKAGGERLFRFEIWWRERCAILVKFEKSYVIAAFWKATISFVFPGEIFCEATGTSARNYTVSKTGVILMYVLHCDNCTCSSLHHRSVSEY